MRRARVLSLGSRRAPAPAERRARGAITVEFALVVGVLMLVLFGMIDFAYYFYVQHVVTTAAREGARSGALWPQDGPSITHATTDACITVNHAMRQGGLAALLPAANCGSACSAPPYACVRVEDSAVTITVPVGSVTGFLPPALIPRYARAMSVSGREDD